jgi:hypothetical protein
MLTSAFVAFAQAGPELLASTIEALRTHPQPPLGKPAYASGKTAQELSYEADDESLTLYGPPHMQTLITGRGPTTTMTAGEPMLSEIIAQWARDKPGFVLNPGSTYEGFGFVVARKLHEEGSALYRSGQPSGLLDDVLTDDYLGKLLASIAAGEMVAITTELQNAIQGK